MIIYRESCPLTVLSVSSDSAEAEGSYSQNTTHYEFFQILYELIVSIYLVGCASCFIPTPILSKENKAVLKFGLLNGKRKLI